MKERDKKQMKCERRSQREKTKDCSNRTNVDFPKTRVQELPTVSFSFSSFSHSSPWRKSTRNSQTTLESIFKLKQRNGSRNYRIPLLEFVFSASPLPLASFCFFCFSLFHIFVFVFFCVCFLSFFCFSGVGHHNWSLSCVGHFIQCSQTRGACSDIVLVPQCGTAICSLSSHSRKANL